MTALNQFLLSAKKAFLQDLVENKSLNEWVLVTGNEAGDLDSVASSIAYAFLSHLQNKEANYIPILLTPAKDLYLRPENMLVLDAVNISVDSLLSIDQFDGASTIAKRGVQFVLVDQNTIPMQFLSVENESAGKVLAILDHHVDEKQHADANPRVIEPVGSCASLVVSHFYTSTFQAEEANLHQISLLLLSAILIDTNLVPTQEGGKATIVDLESAQKTALFSHDIQTLVRTPNTIALLSQDKPRKLTKIAKYLNEVKDSVGHLDGYDLIRRDYKAYQVGFTYGIGTVPISLEEAWFTKPRGFAGLIEDCKKWTAQERIDFVVISTTFNIIPDGGKKKDKVHYRELFVYISPELSSDKTMVLEESLKVLSTRPEIGLQEWKLKMGGVFPLEKNDVRWTIWDQGNSRATRKVIAPLLKDVLEAVYPKSRY